MQRGHTVVRTRVDVHSVAGQHPRYPAGVLQRRDMQGCHTVVRARGEVAVAVEQEGRGGRRIARRGTMQRRIAPAVLRPDIRPVVQQHLHDGHRVDGDEEDFGGDWKPFPAALLQKREKTARRHVWAFAKRDINARGITDGEKIHQLFLERWLPYKEFIELAEKKERETGELVEIWVSY